MSENTKMNQDHWGQYASTYNTKFAKTIQQIINEIQARKDWIGVNWVSDDEDDESEASTKRSVRLLDYACGTGLVSRALAPYVTQTLGIDLTPAMVNEYNASVSNQGIPSSEMHAVVGNLIDASDPSPASLKGEEFWNFDVAVVGLGFHHFDDPGLAAKRLAERLKVGGVLMIVDFLPHGEFGGHGHGHSHGKDGDNSHSHSHGTHGHSHGKHHEEKKEGETQLHAAAHTVTHLGFSEEEVKKMFEDAGVAEGFEYVTVGKGIVFGEGNEKLERSVFMARGSKS